MAEGVINFLNSHVWADEVLHATHPHDFQQCYGFNMWAGFLDGCVIGPYLLPPNLTGNAFPEKHTAWALGRCATARASKHVISL